MHIVLAVEELNKIHGGVERTIVNLANYLSNTGYKITIMTFEKQNEEKPFYNLNFDVDRYYLEINKNKRKFKHCTTRENIKSRLPKSINEIIRNILAIKRVFTVKKNEIPLLVKALQFLKPDIVISFKTHFHRYIIPAAVKAKVPVIASEHNPPEILYYHYVCAVDRFVILRYLKKVDAVRLLIDEFKEGYPEELRSKCVAIPNGIELPDKIADVKNENKNLKIINVGRLYFQKDQATLIEAFAKISKHYPDWKLEIYGDGDKKNHLLSIIKKHELEGKIQIKDAIVDVMPVYQKAKIFALPSLFEGFGNVTLEALSCGLPVIAFNNIAANRYLIKNNRNGLLVSENNRIESFSKGLERLMSDNELRVRLGYNARVSVKQFNQAAIMKKWVKLIERCLSNYNT